MCYENGKFRSQKERLGFQAQAVYPESPVNKMVKSLQWESGTIKCRKCLTKSIVVSFLQDFQGNTNQYTVAKNKIENPFQAVAVRIIPIAYDGRIALRIELYGCDMKWDLTWRINSFVFCYCGTPASVDTEWSCVKHFKSCSNFSSDGRRLETGLCNRVFSFLALCISTLHSGVQMNSNKQNAEGWNEREKERRNECILPIFLSLLETGDKIGGHLVPRLLWVKRRMP